MFFSVSFLRGMENRYSLFGTDCEEGIRVFFSVWRTVRLAQVRGGRVMVPLWNGIGSWEEEGRSHPLMVMGDGGGGDRGSGVPFFVVNSGDDDARRYFQVRFQRFFLLPKNISSDMEDGASGGEKN